MTSQVFDIVIVGSGINSLVCAAILSKRGKRVLVLERNDRIGGCIRTERWFDGYTHDVLSSWYPLFTGSPGYAELKDDLQKVGLTFVQGDYTTGVVTPNGESIALKQGLSEAIESINKVASGDGDAFGRFAGKLFTKDAALTFGLLSNDPYNKNTFKLLFKEWRQRRINGLLDFAVDSLESFRRWSERELKHDITRTMIAPWVLHTGIGPDDGSSALIGKLTFAAVVTGGMPVVKGGSDQLLIAMQKVIEQYGGKVLCNHHVNRVIVQGKKAVGVTANGQTFNAKQAVICNVTPPQLYQSLLQSAPVNTVEKALAYRFGRGDMQIHFALKGKPNWSNPEMAKVPLVHLTESMENVCLSVVQASNGVLPSHPTIAIGQPTAVDESRAPEGDSILWIQMQELPSRLRGDALCEIAIPEDGKWTEEIREKIADRVQQRIEQVLPGLSNQIIGRKAFSPADLEKFNCNLVGGDPYSGICSPDQFFWFRPFSKTNGARAHQTPFKNLYHIGASTHPGPGLGGGSGYLVAMQLS
jgi:phytoene dehydrogenase-like protein